MRKRLGLLLFTALTLAFVLSISAAPVFAEEVAPPSSTDPSVGEETPVPCDPESGYVTGSEGTGEPVALVEGAEIPVDVTPMEKTVDGVGTTDGTDETGVPEDGTTDDRMVALASSNTAGADNAATLPWLLTAGVGVAGLLVGFGTGWLVRRPAKSTTTRD